jgi:hypothetical protein
MPFLYSAEFLYSGNVITNICRDEMGQELPEHHLILKKNQKTMWIVCCDKNGKYADDAKRHQVPLRGQTHIYCVSIRGGTDGIKTMKYEAQMAMTNLPVGSGKLSRAPKPVWNTDLHGPLPARTHFEKLFAIYDDNPMGLYA